MGCVGSRTSVQELRDTSQPAVERVLYTAKPGDTVSFIYMKGQKKGTRREVSFISRSIHPDGGAGFTGRRSSGKVQDYSVSACREMYIPAGTPGLRARQISLESEGSDAI